MKKSKYSERQVFGILKEQELGKSVIEICRTHGITQGTFYRWKSKYSGMESSDIQKMRDLESENSKLKKLYAERCLEIEALKDVLSKKW